MKPQTPFSCFYICTIDLLIPSSWVKSRPIGYRNHRQSISKLLMLRHTGKFVSHTLKFYATILAEKSLRQPHKYLSMRHADRQTNS